MFILCFHTDNLQHMYCLKRWLITKKAYCFVLISELIVPSFRHEASSESVMRRLCSPQARTQKNSTVRRWLWVGRPVNVVKMAIRMLLKAVLGLCIQEVRKEKKSVSLFVSFHFTACSNLHPTDRSQIRSKANTGVSPCSLRETWQQVFITLEL